MPAVKPISVLETELGQRQKEVLFRVGRNLLLYQRIELALKGLHQFLRSENDPAGELSFDSLVVALRTLPLGKQIGRFKEVVAVPAEQRLDLDSYLDQILKARNDLAHNFLVTPGLSLDEVEGCQSAIARLDEAHEFGVPFFQFAAAQLAGLAHAIGGIDQAALERAIANLGGAVVFEEGEPPPL